MWMFVCAAVVLQQKEKFVLVLNWKLELAVCGKHVISEAFWTSCV